MNGYIINMVEDWEMNEYLSPQVYDLLNCIIKPENKRLNTKQMLNHIYIKNVKMY